MSEARPASKLAMLWVAGTEIGSMYGDSTFHADMCLPVLAGTQEPLRPCKCLVKSRTSREHLQAERFGAGIGDVSKHGIMLLRCWLLSAYFI